MMFKPDDRVRLKTDAPFKDSEFVVVESRAQYTDVRAPGGSWFADYTFLTSALELVPQSLSMTCEYCDDSGHLTIECPGLRSGSPIAKAFKAKHFPPPKLVCSACGQPSHPGRKMFCPDDALLCGDCVVGGTPLVTPKAEPLTAADCNSWQTACDEGVD